MKRADRLRAAIRDPSVRAAFEAMIAKVRAAALPEEVEARRAVASFVASHGIPAWHSGSGS